MATASNTAGGGGQPRFDSVEGLGKYLSGLRNPAKQR